MTISYPLSLPATPKPSRVSFYPDPKGEATVSESPFTGQQYVVERDKGLWIAEVTYPPMVRATIQPLLALLNACHFQRGTLLVGPRLFGTILGAGGGTPLVNGASQVGYTLITDGWPNSTLVLKDGDMFGVGNNIYRNIGNATTNGSGQVTLDIWPNARNHANDSPIVTASPKCIMRLIDWTDPGQEETPDKWYSIAFVAREAK